MFGGFEELLGPIQSEVEQIGISSELVMGVMDGDGSFDPDDLTRYELIPSTPVAHAIRACRGTVLSDRLLTAVGDARREGLVTAAEERQLRDELRGNA